MNCTTAKLGRLTLLAGLGMTAVSAHAIVFGVSWNRQSVVRYSDDMNELSSFFTRDDKPNGIAIDGEIIWTGHFTTRTVSAYSRTGAFLYEWTDLSLSKLQSMQYLGNNQLLIQNGPSLQVHNARTGQRLRTMSAVSDSTEGIALDASYVWQIVNLNIFLTRLSDGSVIKSLPNPMAYKPFQGTGIMNFDGSHLLTIASDGSWARIQKNDGRVMASGNSGADLYDLASAVPEPTSLITLGVGMVALFRRRRRIR